MRLHFSSRCALPGKYDIKGHVHYKQSFPWREKNQQDATIRCLLLTSISTCFGHHYAHLQEIKEPVTAFGVLFWFCWMWLVAVVGCCLEGCEHYEGFCSYFHTLLTMHGHRNLNLSLLYPPIPNSICVSEVRILNSPTAPKSQHQQQWAESNVAQSRHVRKRGRVASIFNFCLG